ncbi:TRAP transporter substrate-binding protein [Pigmentiphaga aceris]|uniref:TRAP transporter substrate-binding protein n=1 Tax=Pigmentiphaga aceris TaxID=1940612 RepID=A0A5C0B599_9BURK|nr:TRAP transporter substrate-binding protein [Pigmentiphaga aceris]QEI08031.1 TRAP transporter substrate-binding protein [Pigmentiphaga aceris]
MNHVTTLLVSAFALTSSLLAHSAHAQAAASGPKLQIQAITQVSPNVPQYTKVDQPLLRDGVNKATSGRVDVVLSSWPERNVNGPEVLRLVRSGQVDIAAAALTTVSGDLPMLDAFDLTGMNLDIAQARKVADALMPVANKELERLGIKMVATYPYSGQMLFCRKPVSTLADLKGMKVRVFGPSASDFFKAIGAQPVSLAFGEVYTALERGTVDCGLTGSGSGNSVKWPEVTTSLYTQSLSWSVAGYYVNLAWWNKLDASTRGLLEKTFAEIQDAQWKLGAEATEDGIACNVGRAADCKLHALVKRPMTESKPAADVAAAVHKVVASDVLPGWIKRCGVRCATVYNEVVAPITGIKYAAK